MGLPATSATGLCKIQALLDRITDRAHIIETASESYRLRRTVEKRKGRTPAAAPSAAPSSAERKASELYMVSALVTLIGQGARRRASLNAHEGKTRRLQP